MVGDIVCFWTHQGDFTPLDGENMGSLATVTKSEYSFNLLPWVMSE